MKNLKWMDLFFEYLSDNHPKGLGVLIVFLIVMAIGTMYLLWLLSSELIEVKWGILGVEAWVGKTILTLVLARLTQVCLWGGPSKWENLKKS